MAHAEAAASSRASTPDFDAVLFLVLIVVLFILTEVPDTTSLRVI
jgi:hypothetical protein